MARVKDRLMFLSNSALKILYCDVMDVLRQESGTQHNMRLLRLNCVPQTELMISVRVQES
jgi:hypothetical protein